MTKETILERAVVMFKTTKGERENFILFSFFPTFCQLLSQQIEESSDQTGQESALANIASLGMRSGREGLQINSQDSSRSKTRELPIIERKSRNQMATSVHVVNSIVGLCRRTHDIPDSFCNHPDATLSTLVCSSTKIVKSLAGFICSMRNGIIGNPEFLAATFSLP